MRDKRHKAAASNQNGRSLIERRCFSYNTDTSNSIKSRFNFYPTVRTQLCGVVFRNLWELFNIAHIQVISARNKQQSGTEVILTEEAEAEQESALALALVAV